MSKIKSITCHKLVNSRAEWTIGTKVVLEDGSVGVETVPNGASTGEKEALHIEAEKAVDVVNDVLGRALVGKDVFDQEKLDEIMVELDATENKRNLGGNSILSVSLAAAKAAVNSKGIMLFEYIAQLYGNKDVEKGNLKFPSPVFNILNGGKHAHNNLSFQEFMVIPAKGIKFDVCMEMGVAIYNNLKQKLMEQGKDVDVGDEGGFAPNGFTVRDALGFIRESTSELYAIGEEVFLGMDVAADSFRKNEMYNISEENLVLDYKELSSYYAGLFKDFELIYIEDPFYEKDLAGWEYFSRYMLKKLMVVADDLTVTNPQILEDVIEKKYANAVIVKPNQVGTLTETLRFVKRAKQAQMEIIVSHRSGESGEDTFIADLAVGVGADFIKTGAPARGERVAKYNRILDICYEKGYCQV